MKTKVKTLQGNLIDIDVADDDTVLKVKEKLVEMKPDLFALEGMKLIFSGKILADDKILLTEYSVKETDFLVAMSTKKAPTVDPNLQRLMDMGFQKDQAVNALQAAGNNPDIAAELLMGGDDEGAAPPAAQAGAAAPTPTPAPATATPATATPTPATPNTIPFPGLNAPFPAMGGAAAPQAGGEGAMPGGTEMNLAQNPELLQAILQQVAQVNPEMLQRFQQDPQEFIQMLNNIQNMPEAERMQMLQMMGLGGGGMEGMEGMEGMGGDEQMMQLPEILQGELPELNESEQASVVRLVELGFSQHQALEAYIACDKNENLAANFLFNSM